MISLIIILIVLCVTWSIGIAVAIDKYNETTWVKKDKGAAIIILGIVIPCILVAYCGNSISDVNIAISYFLIGIYEFFGLLVLCNK